jgi:hypothetical protein
VTLSAGAIQLMDQDGSNPFGGAGASVPCVQAVSDGGMTYTLTFTGSSFVGRGSLASSLPNGHFVLALNFVDVSCGSAMVPAGTQTLKFHRLYGDLTDTGYITTAAARADASAADWANYGQFLCNDGVTSGFDSADSSALTGAMAFVTGAQEQSVWNLYNG